MHYLLPCLPRILVLTLAGVLSLHGAVWLPIALVVLVAWGRGFPRVF